CTCEAYQRNLAQHNGHPYCKHIWADQAQRTIETLARAFADVMDVMAAISRSSSSSCRICGRDFTPGEQRDPNGEQCYDLDACMQRKRNQRDAHYAAR